MNDARPEEFEGRIAPERDWREIVAMVGDLPPMPNVSARAMTMVEDPNTTAPMIGELLSSDAALAARILKIANSAMFCRQREITTLNQAVMVIGFKALKGIIVAATLRQMNRSMDDIDKLVWEHAMCTAMSCVVIGRELKKRFADEVFLLGLLHSLGQVVMLSQEDLKESFKGVLDKIRDKHLEYHDAEQDVFGFAHPLLGALVSKKWNFPAESCQVILHYKDPLDQLSASEEQDQKALIIQMGDAISHAAGVGSPEGYPDMVPNIHTIAKMLGFPEAGLEEKIEDLINETRESFERESHIYS